MLWSRCNKIDRTEDYNFKKSRVKYPESFSTFDMLMCISKRSKPLKLVEIGAIMIMFYVNYVYTFVFKKV